MAQVNDLVQFGQNFDFKSEGMIEIFPISTASMSR